MIFGYREVYKGGYICDNTVLFSNDKENITAVMMKEAINHIINRIIDEFPDLKKYRTAVRVLKALRMFLRNENPYKVGEDDAKILIDVIEEVTNLSARNDEERESNSRMALYCRLMVGGFYR